MAAPLQGPPQGRRGAAHPRQHRALSPGARKPAVWCGHERRRPGGLSAHELRGHDGRGHEAAEGVSSTFRSLSAWRRFLFGPRQRLRYPSSSGQLRKCQALTPEGSARDRKRYPSLPPGTENAFRRNKRAPTTAGAPSSPAAERPTWRAPRRSSCDRGRTGRCPRPAS